MPQKRTNSCAQALLFLCSLSCLAQDAQNPSPIIRLTTRLVQVSVLARDKHGNPVSDLKPEDFVLKDDGKEEQIKLFLTSDASAASAPAPPLPPNIFSNRRSGTSSAAPSITVVLFDLLKTAFADQAAAKQQLLAFLGTMRGRSHCVIRAGA